MDAAYDRIGRIEDKIEKLKHKLLRMKQGIHSSDNICLILNHFDRLYEKMNYEERRTLCRQFIQRIEVFPEKGDDKRILKSILSVSPFILIWAGIRKRMMRIPRMRW